METSLPQTSSFRVTGATAGLRLDQAVAQALPGVSRETAKKLIAIGAVWVNKQRVKILSTRVHEGDIVTVHIGKHGWRKRYELDPTNILYEDPWLLFYCKEPGIPSQGIVCDDYNNVAAAVLRYRKQKTSQPYVGLLHRLDLDTSGVMLFTLSPEVNRHIHRQFQNHRVGKTYLALVHGNPEFQHTQIVSYISRRDGRYRCSATEPGKPALTAFTKLSDFEGYALVRAEPQTGRTHQIRLQLSFLGFPVLGDPLYGTDPAGAYPRTMLHAESLTIEHPVTGQVVRVTAGLFEDMEKLLR